MSEQSETQASYVVQLCTCKMLVLITHRHMAAFSSHSLLLCIRHSRDLMINSL